MPKRSLKSPQVAPPAATGNAGPQFEAKVGAFYLLALLAGGEPRGLPGATINTVRFQQRVANHPLDDVIVQATNADRSDAIVEIQAKRSLTFTASDAEFSDVVAQIWQAAQKPEFRTERYELAVAIARTTTRVEHVCQEVLHWARQLPDGATFAAHIARSNFASKEMRKFVEIFRANLAAAGAPTDDETVWRLLRRFQILVFDFENPGSDYEHRARERARIALAADQVKRAAELWPILINCAGACARAGGALTRAAVVTDLEKEHGFRFEQRADLRPVDAWLSEAAGLALDEIKDQVAGVRLARAELIDQAYAALEGCRILHIVGSPGVGKSAVMKHLAQRLQPEGRIIVLRNSRIIPGGWLRMAHEIGCKVSRNELFNELGCGGGATLFIDNIDQIDDPGDSATIYDLLAGVVRNPGWRAVVTGAAGNEEWKTKLPAEVVKADLAKLKVDEISDDEAALLSEGNAALAIILNNGHPARGIARNLFYLSRMIELGADQPEAASGIKTEMDLAHLWWRYGGGRSEDNRRFARLKVLRAMAKELITHPNRVSVKTDDLESPVLADLLQFDSLREDTRGATVAFRHDVLRDWAIGFLLDEQEELIDALPVDKPLSSALARGVEIAARLALEDGRSGARWLRLLAAVERDGAHGSWKRPVLLALTRAENALALLEALKPVLFEAEGRRLGEIIKLMIAVESEPLGAVLARANISIKLPPGAGGIIVPKGFGWMWLVLWLTQNARLLPRALIPDASQVFQAWLISTRDQYALNASIVEILFEWLALIEDALRPRIFRDISEAPPLLRISHPEDVREEIRTWAFAFAHLHPAASERYLRGLDPDKVRHHDLQFVMRFSGTLAKAAPAALVDLALGAIIEKKDPNNVYGHRRERYTPFGPHNHIFTSASPDQGPFLELLQHAPSEGLRLIRGLVEHATQWRRDQYIKAGQSFPLISIPFPAGTKSFEGDWAVYHWSRSIAPSVLTASALMALEAWGHLQIEAGRPIEEVLDDVLGPNGSSLASVPVAIDLVLSHWPRSSDAAWPIVATPELLQFDDARYFHDVTGVDRLLDNAQESGNGTIKRAELNALPSRRRRLSDMIGYYVFQGEPCQLEQLRAALDQARREIWKKPKEEEHPISGLRATAARALRMTYAEHWAVVKIPQADGSEVEARQFQCDPEELEIRKSEAQRVAASAQHFNVRAKVQSALFDQSKSTAEIVAEGIEWAKVQLAVAEPRAAGYGEKEDFDEQWDRRAVAMAAALAARDYEGRDRSEVIAWSMPILNAAASEKAAVYSVANGLIEYNMAAIAAFGFFALYFRDRDPVTRDALLQLASHTDLPVVNALGRHFSCLLHVAPALLRSLIRIVMISCVHPHRDYSESQDEANERARQTALRASIAGERQWLDCGGDEPIWPELPAWLSRPRRGVRIGAPVDEDEDEFNDEASDYYVDEHALAALAGHLIGLTAGDPPSWLVNLAGHLMRWTDQANGPHGEGDDKRDGRPTMWNLQFFDFLGILCIALPHDQAVAMFLEPIMRFNDEPFHDAIAAFLRGFDRATQAADTRDPENPAAVRALVADRIRKTWTYKRLGREKRFTCETHACEALNAMFYQPPHFANRGVPSIPKNWTGLDQTMPTLTALITGAGTSGALATLFLNLVESAPRAALLPFVVQALSAWCSAYGVDTNFWAENGIGTRVCAWLDRTISADPVSPEVLAGLTRQLTRDLDVLVRSGIAQAREVEQKIASIEQERNSL